MSDNLLTAEAAETIALNDVQTNLRRQALNQAVQDHIHTLVEAAAETVQKLQANDAKAHNMGKSQFSNVLDASINAKHVQEIIAYVLYQVGREAKSGKKWAYNGFGGKVIDDLTGVVQKTAHIVAEAAVKRLRDITDTTNVAQQLQPDLLREAQVLLAQQYLGYLGRLFYVALETGDWKRISQLAKLKAEEEAKHG